MWQEALLHAFLEVCRHRKKIDVRNNLVVKQEMTTALLALPLSRICVQEGNLVRYAQDGAQLGSIAVGSITQVDLRTATNWVAVVFGATMLMAGALCFWLATSPIWKWVSRIFFSLFGLLMLICSKQATLLVKTCDGDMAMDVLETRDVAQTFLISLRQSNRIAAQPTSLEPPKLG